VNLLLDTHVYLWWLVDSPRLGAPAREAMSDPGTLVHVSAVSLWEISIKESLGRLDVARDVDLVDEIERSGFVELAVRGYHGVRAGRLPPRHDDPFDRMLVAQAELEGLTLITADRELEQYDVKLQSA